MESELGQFSLHLDQLQHNVRHQRSWFGVPNCIQNRVSKFGGPEVGNLDTIIDYSWHTSNRWRQNEQFKFSDHKKLVSKNEKEDDLKIAFL